MSTTKLVKEFHVTFNQHIGTIEELEPLETRQLRIKLLFEELQELAEAGDVQGTFHSLCSNQCIKYEIADKQSPVDGDNVDIVEELDAITDIQYVLDGKKITSGLCEVEESAFLLVHKNNMTKAHRDKAHAEETIKYQASIGMPCTAIETADGRWLVFNSDDKLTKPHDHTKVSLKYAIDFYLNSKNEPSF